ncbi:MAG: SGNH/GDSL hydrolase family protein [Bacteroides sp.]|jgi:lysophospholipase L1-like esterase
MYRAQSFFLVLFSVLFLLFCSFSFHEGNRILVLGDSNGAAPQGWVMQLKKLRPEDTFCNLAIYGNTIGFDNLKNDTLNTLKNIDSYLFRAVQQMGGIDQVLIWLGSNDCKADFSSLQAEVPNNLDKLLRRIKLSIYSSEAEVIFIAPPPMAADSLLETKYHGGKERLDRLVPHLEKIVRKHRCFFLNIHDSLATDYLRLNSDGIHLNEEGSLKAASIINQYLNKVTR